MIYELTSGQPRESEQMGSLAEDLVCLSSSGVRVLPTTIFPVGSFDEWQQKGIVSDAGIETSVSQAQSYSRGGGNLITRVSLRQAYHGLLEKTVSAPSFSALRSSIERIYRSWSSDRARASRVVRGVPEEESKPGLLVQPFVETIYSVVTRNPVSGAITTESDYGDNVNNQLPRFCDDVDHLVRQCDSVLAKPAKILFTGDEDLGNLTVVSVSDETMTTDGRWRALAELLGRGAIDDIRFLMAVTPDMIGFRAGSEFDPASTPHHVTGLPASRGIASGRVVFPNATIPAQHDRLIFLTDYATPEDIHLLSNCVAGIGLTGGMTSHLAVVSRGLGIPAVTNCGGKLMRQGRVYEMPDGHPIYELSNALVYGTGGIVGFSDEPMTKQRWVRGEHGAALAETLLLLFERLTFDKFKNLPIRTQFHIAQLKARLRDIGVIA